MTVYAAPLRDMRFVIEELIGVDDIAALAPFAEVTADLIRQVLDQAARLGEEVLAPLNRTGDRDGCRLADGAVTTPSGMRDAYARFVAGGWNGMPFDPAHGGGGLPWLAATAVGEIWASANMAFSLCPLLTQSAVELLQVHGSEAQRRIWLPKLITGEWTGAMVMTEPQAGTDLGALKTRAVRDGTEYRVFGQKIFITWGEHDLADNIVHMVLARSPDGPPGTSGLSLFLIPKFLVEPDGRLGPRNDMRCVSLEHKLGIHASPTCLMAYGDTEGAVAYLIGEENRGIEYMFTMMNNARLGVGLEGLALAERAYQQARAYARERVQGRAIGGGREPVTIIHHPDVRRMLLTMKAQIEAIRALDYTAAALIDLARHHPDDAARRAHKARLDLLIPLVKAWGTDLGFEIASLGVQVHGGTGFIEETGAAQHLRDARITQIYEGTNGVQALDLVTRKLPFDNGAAVRDLIETMRSADNALGAGDHPDLAVVRRVLSDGVGVLDGVSSWMLDHVHADRTAAAAGASPYLRLFGTVAGGYLMARAALIADRRLAEGSDDAAFYRAKLATARFYAENVMPQITALARMATGGADTIMRLDEALF